MQHEAFTAGFPFPGLVTGKSAEEIPLSRVQVIDMDKVIVATLFAHSDVGDLFWLFVQRVFEVFAGDGEAGPLISLKELVYHHDKLFWQYFD